jgi:protein required for attachment to host cells
MLDLSQCGESRAKYSVELKMEFEVRAFDRLVLVAPLLMLEDLRFCINDALASKIVAEVGKDLTNYDSEALKEELNKIVWF